MLTFIFIFSFLVGLLFYAFIIEPRRLKQRHYLIKKEKQTVLDISKAISVIYTFLVGSNRNASIVSSVPRS